MGKILVKVFWKTLILVASISREYRGEVGRKKATTKVKRRQQSGAFEKKKSPLTFTTGFNQEIEICSRKDFS